METINDHLGQFDHPSAVARSTDPETSWEAAKKIVDIRESQAKVWSVLVEIGPMTDEGILDAMTKRGWDISPSGCRTRRKELCKLGLVKHNTLRNDKKDYSKTIMGNRSRVWRALNLAEWRKRYADKFVTREMF